MSAPVYRATIERVDELGRCAGSGEVNGELEHVLGVLRLEVEVMLRKLQPGERLQVEIERQVGPDHPLAGVDLTS